MSRDPAVRSYDQWCPIAVGLDVIGDRWTLLVLRELAIGDARFTDLKRALSGIAPNLLTERLRSLADHGLVTSVELPPPAARSVYRLTDAGRDVIPVLRALARFGASHLDDRPGPAMDATRAAHALLLPWRRTIDLPLRARLTTTSAALGEPTSALLELDLHDTRVRREVPGADIVDAAEAPVDVELVTTVEHLADLRAGRAPLPERPTGNRAARQRFKQAFQLDTSG